MDLAGDQRVVNVLVDLVMGFVDAVSDVDERPIARKLTSGACVAALLLLVASQLFWRKK